MAFIFTLGYGCGSGNDRGSGQEGARAPGTPAERRLRLEQRMGGAARHETSTSSEREHEHEHEHEHEQRDGREWQQQQRDEQQQRRPCPA